MKEQLAHLLKLESQLNDLTEDYNNARKHVLTPELDKRISKINRLLHLFENDIIRQNKLYGIYYAPDIEDDYNVINFTSMGDEDFIVTLTQLNLNECDVTWTLTIPYDPTKDQEYIDKRKAELTDKWNKVVAQRREQDLKDKQQELERLQKQISNLKG